MPDSIEGRGMYGSEKEDKMTIPRKGRSLTPQSLPTFSLPLPLQEFRINTGVYNILRHRRDHFHHNILHFSPFPSFFSTAALQIKRKFICSFSPPLSTQLGFRRVTFELAERSSCLTSQFGSLLAQLYNLVTLSPVSPLVP